jgi:hypothetical protein
MLDDSEIEDFNSELAKAGFNVDDFNPIAQEDDLVSGVIEATTGTVTVHRNSTDQSITYQAGNGPSWVVSFVTDLVAGKFGES